MNARYLCLSYVWGGFNTVKNTAENIDSLPQPKSLSNDSPWYRALPQTIKDAMFITIALRERFLWVDCLCVRQDLLRDRNLHLDAMAVIYANAHLTIVAAEGHDANLGIRGLKLPCTGRRNVPNIDFMGYSMKLRRRCLVSEEIAEAEHVKWASGAGHSKNHTSRNAYSSSMDSYRGSASRGDGRSELWLSRGFFLPPRRVKKFVNAPISPSTILRIVFL